MSGLTNPNRQEQSCGLDQGKKQNEKRQGRDAQIESEREYPQASSKDGVPGQGQEELADDREVPALPSCALLALSGLSLWKLAENPCLRTEVRGLADECQLGGVWPGLKSRRREYCLPTNSSF